MLGVRLESEVCIITSSRTSTENLLRCVSRAGYTVDNVMLKTLCSAQAAVSEEERELGSIVIDLGGGTTDVLGTNYVHWYLNTLQIACMNTVLTVLLCSTVGYIFSRFTFPFRKTVMASMIILQMFPSFIGMIATYVILWKINGLNTLWGLVLVYAAGSLPFNSWLMKGYFDTVPKELAEAAYIDGASPFKAFIRVVLPAAKPQLVFLALTSFTGPWMDFIFPRLVLRSDDKKTLAVGLYEMISGRAADNFTMFAAGALLVAVPFTVLFMLGQKALIQSLAGTGGKE